MSKRRFTLLLFICFSIIFFIFTCIQFNKEFSSNKRYFIAPDINHRLGFPLKSKEQVYSYLMSKKDLLIWLDHFSSKINKSCPNWIIPFWEIEIQTREEVLSDKRVFQHNYLDISKEKLDSELKFTRSTDWRILFIKKQKYKMVYAVAWLKEDGKFIQEIYPGGTLLGSSTTPKFKFPQNELCRLFNLKQPTLSISQ
jgi:hypothetical protein